MILVRWPSPGSDWRWMTAFPHRQFVRARRYADEAAGLTVSPAVRARASIAYWLPDILLGGGRVAREQLAHAARLAETAGDRQLCRRLDLLNCLIAHDVADADFPAKWAQVTAHGEIDPNAEWSWLIMRVAMERGTGEPRSWPARCPRRRGPDRWLTICISSPAPSCWPRSATAMRQHGS